MDQARKVVVAEAWLRRQQRTSPDDDFTAPREDDPDDEVAFELNTAVFGWPDDALDIVLLILERTDREWDLINVGAGPVESLLMFERGGAIIDRLEAEAERNPRLVQALAHVWLDEDEPVYPRVAAIVARLGSLQ